MTWKTKPPPRSQFYFSHHLTKIKCLLNLKRITRLTVKNTDPNKKIISDQVEKDKASPRCGHHHSDFVPYKFNRKLKIKPQTVDPQLWCRFEWSNVSLQRWAFTHRVNTELVPCLSWCMLTSLCYIDFALANLRHCQHEAVKLHERVFEFEGLRKNSWFLLMMHHWYLSINNLFTTDSAGKAERNTFYKSLPQVAHIFHTWCNNKAYTWSVQLWTLWDKGFFHF